MTKKWLDIPSLSQGNKADMKNSQLWCGRTSVSMVFNYYQKVNGKDNELIVNDQEKGDLFYHNGAIAADRYKLDEPLNKALAGWKRKELFPASNRELPVSKEKIKSILEPVINSLNINNPVVFYSGLSRGVTNARHIVVISGYMIEEDATIWLLIDDPATMRDTDRKTEKADFLKMENLKILDSGQWNVRGAQYWLKAKRLFEENAHSEKTGDLWCDHGDRDGFSVWLNDTLIPDSQYSHYGAGYSFPVALSIGSTSFESYYNHTEKKSRGGFFPIGANTIWHGGVHIHVTEPQPVYACMSGRIIAARLPDASSKAIHSYGSRNFILLEHELNGKKFYSLYMHLNYQSLSPTDDFITKVGWLQQQGDIKYRVKVANLNYRKIPSSKDNEPLGQLKSADEVKFISDATPAPWKKVRLIDGREVYINCAPQYVTEITETVVNEKLLEELKKGAVVKLDIPVNAGDLLWRSGEYGSLGTRAKLLHWEIFSEENLFAQAESKKNDTGNTSSGYSGATGWKKNLKVLVKGVEPKPTTAYPGERVTYKTSEFNYSDAPKVEYQKVNWLIEVDSKTIEDFKMQGPTLEYQIPKSLAGKTLKVKPYINVPTDKVCVTTLVATYEKIEWKAIEDSDNDFNIDSKKVLDLFGSDLLGSDNLLTGEELIKFYKENPHGKAAQLRDYACKFVSEWGIPDLDKALDNLKKHRIWPTWGLKDRIAPYLWWQEAKDKGVNLPKSPHVWHYNPIRFLEQLNPPSIIQSVAKTESECDCDKPTENYPYEKDTFDLDTVKK